VWNKPLYQIIGGKKMGLITNFASGEISPNMFGRIDLPQYHSAAARLENWDVIPTGGIKRRSGMERLAEVGANEKTRLIPVIISREEKYLLLFSHEKITVYKAEGNASIKTFTNASVSPGSLYKENEIPEVQYAQNQNMVVFTHQNHPPIRMEFYKDNVSISVLNIFILVSFECEPGLRHGFAPEEDKFYKIGYLKEEGQYPRSVAFFNNRLVFAATKNNKQRLFFSQVNRFSDFSTYKTFVREEKTIVEVRVKITMGNKVVQFVDFEEAEKIKSHDTKNYYTESRFFPEGTFIQRRPYIDNDKSWMELSNPPQNIFRAAPADYALVEGDIESKVIAYNNKNNNPDLIRHIKDFNKIINNNVSGGDVDIYIYASYFYLEANDGKSVLAERLIYGRSIDYNIPSKLIEDRDKGTDIAATIRNMIEQGCADLMSSISGFSLREVKTNNAVSTILSNSAQYLSYFYRGNSSTPLPLKPIYYGYMPDIKTDVLSDLTFVPSGEVYLILYTKEFKKEDMVTPDCGFTFEPSSGTNDAIKWLSVNRGIIVGTELSEFFIPPDIHANNTQAVALSRYGSDDIQGAAIGAATVFFQSGRKGLVEYYPNEYDQFRANNMALLAQHMLHESPAKEFDFATAPYTRLYITREDGTLVTLLYERGTGTFAWSRITTGEAVRDTITPEEVEEERKYATRRGTETYTTERPKFVPPKRLKRFVEGKIVTCAVLPGDDGFDDVYLIVKRKSKFYLERIRESGTVYLDGWKEWKYANESERRALLDSYDAETAGVYDEGKNEFFKLSAKTGELPASSGPGNRRYIGYPYKSVMKSVPVLKNEKMEPVSASAICVRLHDSYIPYITFQGDAVEGEPGKAVYDDYVIREPGILSGQSRNLQFYITHNTPNRCCMLSVYTEV
jgi:hypothetical protein